MKKASSAKAGEPAGQKNKSSMELKGQDFNAYFVYLTKKISSALNIPIAKLLADLPSGKASLYALPTRQKVHDWLRSNCFPNTTALKNTGQIEKEFLALCLEVPEPRAKKLRRLFWDYGRANKEKK